jgi:hypothetical protein
MEITMSPKSYATKQPQDSTPTPEPPADPSLADLVAGLAAAKAASELAGSKQIEWEERIAEKAGGPKDGQKTTTLEDGTKVTVTRGYNYKTDCLEIQALFRKGQFDHPAPVTTKTTMKLDERGYKWYEKTYPSVYKQIARFVVATPKKIAVTLKAPKA